MYIKYQNDEILFSLNMSRASLFSTSLAMQCDYGSVYLPCGTACPETCPGHGQNITEFCESMTCSEGCFCPEGYVRSSKNATFKWFYLWMFLDYTELYHPGFPFSSN